MWYETWRRFLEENEKRWEENRKRWEENEKRWEAQFSFNRWVRSALTEIRDALGGGFEYFAARVVEAVLRERGVECSVRVNVTLPVDGFKEVDLFCPEPLVVGEVSVAVRSVEEAEGLLEQLRRAAEAGEKLTKRRPYLKVLAVEFALRDVAEYLKARCEGEGVYLILGRDYDRLNI
jgi:PaREP7